MTHWESGRLVSDSSFSGTQYPISARRDRGPAVVWGCLPEDGILEPTVFTYGLLGQTSPSTPVHYPPTLFEKDDEFVDTGKNLKRLQESQTQL